MNSRISGFKATPALMRDFRLAARSEMTVLILGPTGSGKSTAARAIHAAGDRMSKPFISVNLATLHEGTFESELFGHERGAFTGAESRRVGRFELAQNGTLFLDEIGELPLSLQGRLLEFLQSKVITPVGGNREICLNVRIIAATNRDLAADVEAGRFREDLYHRLRVLSIRLAGINEMADSFDNIVHKVLEDLCSEHGRLVHRLSEEVAQRLEQHPWPGNFRELRHVLEYCVLASEGTEIVPADLPAWFRSSKQPHGVTTSSDPLDESRKERVTVASESLKYNDVMHDFERDYLAQKLTAFHGKVSLTSRRLSMSKTTLLRRMRLLGLRVTAEGDVFRDDNGKAAALRKCETL